MNPRTTAAVLSLVVHAHLAGQVPGGMQPEIRQVPLDRVLDADRRPLTVQRVDYLRGLLALELEALTVEATLPSGGPEDRPPRQLDSDRTSMLQMRELLEAPLPDPVAPEALAIADKFLFLFALDRLEAESLDAGRLERWEQANRAFIADPGWASRRESLQHRRFAFVGIDRLAVLRGIATRLAQGPVSHAERVLLLGKLKDHYPDAPFFAVLPPDSGDVPPSAGTLLDSLLGGAARTAPGGLTGLFGPGTGASARGAPGLPGAAGAPSVAPAPAPAGPRLDGVEPAVPLPDVRSLRRPATRN